MTEEYELEAQTLNGAYKVKVNGYSAQFIYKPVNYDGSKVIDAIPSKECDEYHKNSYVQINVSKDLLSY